MSAGLLIPFEDALAMAAEVVDELKPHVVRMKAVGSLRRQRSLVGDLEFVVEPHMVTVDLFGAEGPDLTALKARLLAIGAWVKGRERMIQITDLLGRQGMKLDLFLVWPPAQWGSILAIRTGPAGGESAEVEGFPPEGDAASLGELRDLQELASQLHSVLSNQKRSLASFRGLVGVHPVAEMSLRTQRADAGSLLDPGV